MSHELMNLEGQTQTNKLTQELLIAYFTHHLMKRKGKTYTCVISW